MAASALAGVVESTMLRLLLSIVIAGAAAAIAGILIGVINTFVIHGFLF